jgi:hypothetical protein
VFFQDRVIVGLLFAMVGIVPVGILASIFHADWTSAIYLTIGAALTYGARWFALWLAIEVYRAEEDRRELIDPVEAHVVGLAMWVKAVGFIMLITAIGGSTFFYVKIADAPTKQTEYAGLRLGMTMKEVLYERGNPTAVWGPVEKEGDWQPEIMTAELKKNESVKDSQSWTYFAPNSWISLEFDAATKSLVEIGCWSDKGTGECPPLFGLRDGTTEENLIARLGQPNRELFDNEIKTMEFDHFGVRYYLRRKKVSGFRVRNYARKETDH